MESIETILSQRGEAVSEQPSQDAEQHVAQQTPESEVSQGASTEPEVTHDDGEQGSSQGNIPTAALQAERQKARSYREELAEARRAIEETRKSNEEIRRHNEELTRRFTESQQQQQPTPSIYEDEAGAIRYQARQEFDPELARMREAHLFNSKLVARNEYGKDKFPELIKAYDDARASGLIDDQTHARVLNSPNPFVAGIETYERELPRINPEAYRQKVIAEYEAQKAQQQSEPEPEPQPQQRQVMPTSNFGARTVGPRTGPAWSGPSPVNDIFARHRGR